MKTWLTNEVFTSADANLYIRDLGAISLCIATVGGHQIANAGTWPNPPGLTNVLFPVEIYDSDGMHSTVTNTDRFTPTFPGWYQVSSTSISIRGYITVQNADIAVTTYPSSYVFKNGNVYPYFERPIFSCNGTTDYFTITTVDNETYYSGYSSHGYNTAVVDSGKVGIWRIRGL
jgi:hypothetical protein